jgi:hypothetical protein
VPLLQLLHASQFVLQQWPSAEQKLDVHWSPVLQELPLLSRGAHCPLPLQ